MIQTHIFESVFGVYKKYFFSVEQIFWWMSCLMKMSKFNLTAGLTKVWEGPWELALSRKMSQTWGTANWHISYISFTSRHLIFSTKKYWWKKKIIFQLCKKCMFRKGTCDCEDSWGRLLRVWLGSNRWVTSSSYCHIHAIANTIVKISLCS